MTQYILFVAECANFCPRVALIPADEYKTARQDHYDLMKKHAVKYNGIDQVLFQDFHWTEHSGRGVNHEWSHAVSDITFLIEQWHDRNHFGEDKDRPWIDKMITDFTGGHFNAIKIMQHVTNVEITVDGEPIVISDSFLILEMHDGIVKNPPKFDTVTEFLADYHGVPLEKRVKTPVTIIHLKSPVWKQRLGMITNTWKPSYKKK
uniref:Uncharacterized protein n=1 Tax=viral metagenome TaxID=1070528 RepID=A0A6C0JRI9_9ZZZZ